MRVKPDSELWTLNDIAAYAGVHLSTAKTWFRSGILPAPDVDVFRTRKWLGTRVKTALQGMQERTRGRTA